MTAENQIIVLSFIAGPAIMANACAILQNGAAIRYSLAVSQWREFHASLLARDQRLAALFANPTQALKLAERRIRLQLRQTRLLLAAACLFASTSLLALLSALGTHAGAPTTELVATVAMLSTGMLALLGMFSATVTFFMEGACAERMMGMHSPLLTIAEATFARDPRPLE